MWVELTGPVGAGKSALQPVAAEALRSLDLRVLPLPGGVAGDEEREVADRSRDLTSGSRSWKRGWAAILFCAARPGLCFHVARALLSAPLPLGHRRAIAALVIKLAALDQQLQGRHGVDVVVIDEGWVHRAINIFAWTATVSDARLEAYLRSIPLPDVVVVVDAPTDQRERRLRERGLPKRLRGKPPEVIDRFLVRSSLLVDLAADWLKANRVVVIRVANDGRLTEASAELTTALASAVRHGRSPRVSTPVVRMRWPFPVPRPDRTTRRVRRGPLRSGPQLEDAIAAVLVEYGLPPQRPRLIEGSGRSLAMRVKGPMGEAVLKRYKPTVSHDAILGQHAILLELASAGFPSPRLLSTVSGSTLLEHGEHRFDMTEFLSGFARWDRSLVPRRESDRLRTDAGGALAAFHGALRGFEPPYAHESRVAPLPSAAPGSDEIEATMERCLARVPPDLTPGRWRRLWNGADSLRDEFVRCSRSLQRAELPLRVIHGDYGPYNLLIRRDRPLTIMDLELARIDWRLIDLARAIPRFATNRRGFSVDRARQFVTGYLARDPVPDAELALMPDLIRFLELRRVLVCWGRYADAGDTDWLDAAMEHLVNAERASRPSHPLALLLMAMSVDER